MRPASYRAEIRAALRERRPAALPVRPRDLGPELHAIKLKSQEQARRLLAEFRERGFRIVAKRPRNLREVQVRDGRLRWLERRERV